MRALHKADKFKPTASRRGHHGVVFRILKCCRVLYRTSYLSYSICRPAGRAQTNAERQILEGDDRSGCKFMRIEPHRLMGVDRSPLQLLVATVLKPSSSFIAIISSKHLPWSPRAQLSIFVDARWVFVKGHCMFVTLLILTASIHWFQES